MGPMTNVQNKLHLRSLTFISAPSTLFPLSSSSFGYLFIYLYNIYIHTHTHTHTHNTHTHTFTCCLLKIKGSVLYPLFFLYVGLLTQYIPEITSEQYTDKFLISFHNYICSIVWICHSSLGLFLDFCPCVFSLLPVYLQVDSFFL